MDQRGFSKKCKKLFRATQGSIFSRFGIRSFYSFILGKERGLIKRLEIQPT